MLSAVKDRVGELLNSGYCKFLVFGIKVYRVVSGTISAAIGVSNTIFNRTSLMCRPGSEVHARHRIGFPNRDCHKCGKVLGKGRHVKIL